MSEIPQAFRDAIETEWRHDYKMNADTLTMRFRATARSMQSSEDTARYKELIEKCVASKLYKLVSGIVGDEDENVKLRELVADMWRWMCSSYSRNCFACKHYPRAASPNCECEFRTRMRELGIEVDA